MFFNSYDLEEDKKTDVQFGGFSEDKFSNGINLVSGLYTNDITSNGDYDDLDNCLFDNKKDNDNNNDYLSWLLDEAMNNSNDAVGIHLKDTNNCGVETFSTYINDIFDGSSDEVLGTSNRKENNEEKKNKNEISFISDEDDKIQDAVSEKSYIPSDKPFGVLDKNFFGLSFKVTNFLENKCEPINNYKLSSNATSIVAPIKKVVKLKNRYSTNSFSGKIKKQNKKSTSVNINVDDISKFFDTNNTNQNQNFALYSDIPLDDDIAFNAFLDEIFHLNGTGSHTEQTCVLETKQTNKIFRKDDVSREKKNDFYCHTNIRADSEETLIGEERNGCNENSLLNPSSDIESLCKDLEFHLPTVQQRILTPCPLTSTSFGAKVTHKKRHKRDRPPIIMDAEFFNRNTKYWDFISRQFIYINLKNIANKLFKERGIQYLDLSLIKDSTLNALQPNFAKIEDFDNHQNVNGWIYKVNSKCKYPKRALRWCGQRLDFYTSYIIREKIDGTKKEGLCPYCPLSKCMNLDTVFRDFSTSAYKHHLNTNHGVNCDGTECDPPVFGLIDHIQYAYCSKCKDAIVIPRANEKAKDNRLIGYFRHWIKCKSNKDEPKLRKKAKAAFETTSGNFFYEDYIMKN